MSYQGNRGGTFSRSSLSLFRRRLNPEVQRRHHILLLWEHLQRQDVHSSRRRRAESYDGSHSRNNVTEMYFVNNNNNRNEGFSPVDEIQGDVAVQILKLASVVQSMFPRMPRDLGLRIASFAVDHRSLPCCGCDDRSVEAIWFENEGLSAVDARTERRDALIVCASCGRPRRATVRPKIPPSLPWDDRSSVVAVGAMRTRDRASPSWRPCRHFHAEGENGSGAARHRLSGFHSFRTIVCDEWVLDGAVSYRLAFRSLTRPCSGGVGVVTPDAEVNSDVAWCPGTRGRSNAWGLCVEGREENETERRSGMRAIEETVVCSSSSSGVGGAQGTNGRSLTNLAEFDEFRVTINASNRTATIDGPLQHANRRTIFHINLEDENIAAANNVKRDFSTGFSEKRRSPFALAVALKYAGDQVLLLSSESM